MKANFENADAYFIKLVDQENVFMHPTGESEKEIEYTAKHGADGAAIFRLENAKNFIKESGYDNLKPVHITKILK